MEQPTPASSKDALCTASPTSSVAILAQDEISLRISKLAGWTYEPEAGGIIKKEFRFADFVGAFGFMTQVALHAERLNHHPEWTNVYDRVTVRLTTHDVGGLSAKDFEMARQMDRMHGSDEARTSTMAAS